MEVSTILTGAFVFGFLLRFAFLKTNKQQVSVPNSEWQDWRPPKRDDDIEVLFELPLLEALNRILTPEKIRSNPDGMRIMVKKLADHAMDTDIQALKLKAYGCEYIDYVLNELEKEKKETVNIYRSCIERLNREIVQKIRLEEDAKFFAQMNRSSQGNFLGMEKKNYFERTSQLEIEAEKKLKEEEPFEISGRILSFTGGLLIGYSIVTAFLA